MIRYFDTSALVKHYVQETGSDSVGHLLTEQGVTLSTSALTRLEGFHAICRKCLEGKVSPKIKIRLLRQFESDLQAFQLVEINSARTEEAKQLIRKTALKTLDAIHIASALLFKKQKLKTEFISCDEPQSRVARQQGLITRNPLMS